MDMSLDGKRLWFEGRFVGVRGWYSGKLLFRDVTYADGTGQVFRDHVYVSCKKWKVPQHLSPETYYRFEAEVYHYQRGGKKDSNGVYRPLRMQVGLQNPTGFRRLGT